MLNVFKRRLCCCDLLEFRVACHCGISSNTTYFAHTLCHRCRGLFGSGNSTFSFFHGHLMGMGWTWCSLGTRMLLWNGRECKLQTNHPPSPRRHCTPSCIIVWPTNKASPCAVNSVIQTIVLCAYSVKLLLCRPWRAIIYYVYMIRTVVCITNHEVREFFWEETRILFESFTEGGTKTSIVETGVDMGTATRKFDKRGKRIPVDLQYTEPATDSRFLLTHKIRQVDCMRVHSSQL